MSVYWNKQRHRWVYDFELNGERCKGYCLDAEGKSVTSKKVDEHVETTVRAGNYTLAQAAAVLLTRLLVDRDRKATHVDNQRLYFEEDPGLLRTRHCSETSTRRAVANMSATAWRSRSGSGATRG